MMANRHKIECVANMTGNEKDCDCGLGWEHKDGNYQAGHENYNRLHTKSNHSQLSSAGEDKITPIIESETGVEKPEGAEQRLELPNQNLMIIEEIEGLLSQVNEKLYNLPTDGMLIGKGEQRGKALEEIDLFRKTTLFELRCAFEYMRDYSY